MKITERKVKRLADAIETCSVMGAFDVKVYRNEWDNLKISFEDGNSIPHEIEFYEQSNMLEVGFRDENGGYHWYCSMKLENQNETQATITLAIVLKQGQDQAIDFYTKEWEKTHNAG